MAQQQHLETCKEPHFQPTPLLLSEGSGWVS